MSTPPQQLAASPEDTMQVLWHNPEAARRVIHALLKGRHIDLYLAEEFHFLENYASLWERFFDWLGYQVKRSELGGSPFFYLEPATELVTQTRLSRGATFLGLYTAWHFFMQGPGEPEKISGEEVFRRLVSSYPFPFLRTVFLRKSSNAAALELSEDQAEKLRGYIKRELGELAKYRFIDVKPNPRAAWEDLVIYRLPALYRFWELALQVRATDAHDPEAEPDLDQVVEQVWGRVETGADEDET